MPELPEVETIVRDLNKKLAGRKITGLKIIDQKAFQAPKSEIKKIIGKSLRSAERRAKMIILNLGDNYLVIHLKMTGQLVLKTKNSLIAGGHPIIGIGQKLPNKFTRLIFKFNNDRLYFNDVRRFGWAKLLNKENYLMLSGGLGIEPLSKDFTLDYFKKIFLKRPRLKVKQAIMDQKYIAGIGNIYADEALFLAGIKPFKLVKSLNKEEVKKLWQAIPKILKFAIKHRGTSFSDYVDARGEVGNFMEFLNVYGRGDEKCRVCGNIIKKMKLAGRGTHWCPICQK